MSKNTIDKLFGSRIRVKLLRFLFRNYPGSFEIKEIAQKIQESQNDLKIELDLLTNLGLLKKQKNR
jgi:predicted transcriptional regulator